MISICQIVAFNKYIRFVEIQNENTNLDIYFTADKFTIIFLLESMRQRDLFSR